MSTEDVQIIEMEVKVHGDEDIAQPATLPGAADANALPEVPVAAAADASLLSVAPLSDPAPPSPLSVPTSPQAAAMPTEQLSPATVERLRAFQVFDRDRAGLSLGSAPASAVMPGLMRSLADMFT